MKSKLIIATCQHPVSGNIDLNQKYILDQMKTAKEKEVDIVHFSESNLSGYPGIDFLKFQAERESQLRTSLAHIVEAAGDLKLWVIIGSHHYKEETEKPYNCLHLISSEGVIADRYDKRILAGFAGELENKYYQPGRDPLVFELQGIKCGLLICHEWRYPELYREYGRLGVDVLFQSWYDGNMSKKKFITEGRELGDLIVGTVRGNAANNYLWISGSNTSKKESCFASFMVQPDGKVTHKLQRNRPGVLISELDFSKIFVDPSASSREKLFKMYGSGIAPSI